MTQLPNFTVNTQSGVSVHWQDERKGARYHFWLNNDGTLRDDCIYRNPIERDPNERYKPTIHLDATAKKWAPVVQAMLAEIRDGDLIYKADVERKAKEDSEAAQERAAHCEKLREVGERVLGRCLDDDTLLALELGFAQARRSS